MGLVPTVFHLFLGPGFPNLAHRRDKAEAKEDGKAGRKVWDERGVSQGRNTGDPGGIGARPPATDKSGQCFRQLIGELVVLILAATNQGASARITEDTQDPTRFGPPAVGDPTLPTECR